MSFVRDFESLLGDAFFKKIKSFTPMQTDTDDLEGGMIEYLEKLESLGGIDLFLLGLWTRSGSGFAFGLYQAEFGRNIFRRGWNYPDFAQHFRTSR